MDSSAFTSSACGKTHFCSSTEIGMTRSSTAVSNVSRSGLYSLTLLQKARDCSPFIGLV